MGTNTTNNYCSYSAVLLHLPAILLHLSAQSVFCTDSVKIAFPHKDNKTSFFFSEQVVRLNSVLTKMFFKCLIIS